MPDQQAPEPDVAVSRVRSRRRRILAGLAALVTAQPGASALCPCNVSRIA